MMVVVMKKDALVKDVGNVIKHIESLSLVPHVSEGEEKTIIGFVADERIVDKTQIFAIGGVEDVVPILKPYKLASLEFKGGPSTISFDGTHFGGKEVTVIAGPCAVESYEQLRDAAICAKEAGASVVRGGAFKPRTSPYSFQGLGVEGLKILARVRDEVGLPVITECLSPEHVGVVAEYADMIQIGARNMQNFSILEKVGRYTRPVLLKRGMMSTVEELLMSAEYILSNGNPSVILCERGIRTFERITRNTCDISAVPALKKLTHLPVIVDPSHATGERDMVAPLSLAAVAAGADGLIVEIHPDPDNALCDGYQSLHMDQFRQMMEQVGAIAKVVGKSL